MTQSGLAESLGVTFQQLQKYERGDNRVSASMLVRIAKALETTVGNLVGEAKGGSVIHPHALEILSVPGAPALLDAYASLSSPQLQAAVLQLTRTLAGEAQLAPVPPKP